MHSDCAPEPCRESDVSVQRSRCFEKLEKAESLVERIYGRFDSALRPEECSSPIGLSEGKPERPLAPVAQGFRNIADQLDRINIRMAELLDRCEL